MATGECATNPCVHIWTILTLEPTKILKTFHKNGILQMAFSTDGVFLITIGMDSYFR